MARSLRPLGRRNPGRTQQGSDPPSLHTVLVRAASPRLPRLPSALTDPASLQHDSCSRQLTRIHARPGRTLRSTTNQKRSIDRPTRQAHRLLADPERDTSAMQCTPTNQTQAGSQGARQGDRRLAGRQANGTRIDHRLLHQALVAAASTARQFASDFCRPIGAALGDGRVVLSNQTHGTGPQEDTLSCAVPLCCLCLWPVSFQNP